MKPGIYRISNEEYHADELFPVASLSRGVIKDLINKSPAHAFYNHPRLNPNYHPSADKVQFDIGGVAHSLLLEGIDKAEIIDADDWRTKAAKKTRDEARTQRKLPLLKHQYDEVVEMVKEAEIALSMSKLSISISKGDSELSYFWNEGETWLRARPDWISKDRTILLDYKTTTQSANPEDYSRLIVSTGLDIQKSLYTRGVLAVDGVLPKFVLMVQEIYPPYLCSFIELDAMFSYLGDQKVDRGIKIWRECMSTGKWPGYSNGIYRAEVPAWALAQWEIKNQTISPAEGW